MQINTDAQIEQKAQYQNDLDQKEQVNYFKENLQSKLRSQFGDEILNQINFQKDLSDNTSFTNSDLQTLQEKVSVLKDLSNNLKTIVNTYNNNYYSNSDQYPSQSLLSESKEQLQEEEKYSKFIIQAQWDEIKGDFNLWIKQVSNFSNFVDNFVGEIGQIIKTIQPLVSDTADIVNELDLPSDFEIVKLGALTLESTNLVLTVLSKIQIDGTYIYTYVSAINYELNKQDDMVLLSRLFSQLKQDADNLSWWRKYLLGGWIISEKANELAQKTTDYYQEAINKYNNSIQAQQQYSDYENQIYQSYNSY